MRDLRATLRTLMEASLTRLPGLYARLISWRREPNLEKIVFLSLIRRGDTVLDVGANTGYYSLLFSHLAGALGSVHAFEPVPPTFSELEANVRRARRSGNMVLNRCALSDTAGTATLYMPGDDHGQAALTRHTFGSWTERAPVRTFSCPVTTLDAYMASQEVGAPSFVKCDVEGAELPVLRGAAGTIGRFTPLLLLEVSRHWSASFSYEPADAARFLETFGYSRFFLVTDRLLPVSGDLRDLDPGRVPDSANLLCAHGRHARRLARLRPWLP